MKKYYIFTPFVLSMALISIVYGQGAMLEADAVGLNPQPDPPSKATISNIGSSGEDGVREISNIGSSGQDGVSVKSAPVSNIGSSGQDGVRQEANIGSSGQDGVRSVSDTDSGGIEHEDDWKGEEVEASDDEEEKDNLVKSISTPGSANRAIYIKIGDIKGESKDSDDGSENESKSSKPKEIVVVGSKVRGWDPKTKEEIVGAAPSDSSEVKSSDDLALFVAKSTSEDENIESVTLNFAKVEFEYKQPARFLGLFAIEMTNTVSVSGGSDESGRVKVKLPWWSMFAKELVPADELIEEIEKAMGDDAQLANIDLQNSLQAARVFQTMSNVSKMLHDTAMSIIRKIG